MNARCPNCRGPITLPAAPAVGTIKCPACQATIRLKPKAAPSPVVAKPVVAPPTPPVVETVEPFVFDGPVIARKPEVRKKSGGLFWVAFVLLLVVGLGAAAVGLKLIPMPAVATVPTTTQPPTEMAEVKSTPAKPAPLPRRLLVMSVSKYLYCNRLTAGVGRNGVDLPTEVGKRLAFDWRVPQEPGNQQLVVLSDTSPDPRPMLKPILTQTVADFCRTSRPQDRVLIYFGGHAVEAGGKAYLVPAEGDFAEPDGLIPLDDFWSKLKDCPATQKAVVFDVCRMNEDDDRVRPGGEPMTPELEKLLLAAPAGVQVVLTCSAGQQAREFRRTPSDPTAGDVTGSLFLSGLRHVAARGKLTATPPKADDPLPVAEWVEAIGKRADAVCEVTGQKKPTAKVGGTPAAALVAVDLAAPPAEAVSLPPMPKGIAASEVAKLNAVIGLPPIREQAIGGDEDTGIPFAVERMKEYAPGQADSPIGVAATEALSEIRNLWVATTGDSEMGGLRTQFTGATDDALKRTIARDQETPARLILAFEDRSRMLDALADRLKDEKSAYWRATFQYAQAQVKARLAFMHEYNLLLGNVRTDSLPPRDMAKGETGLQLVSVAKMKSKKDVLDMAAAAQDLFAAVAKDHAGTPWAVASKRAKAEALGLEWRPFAPGGKAKD